MESQGNQYCTGCSVCASICKYDAIKIVLTFEIFPHTLEEAISAQSFGKVHLCNNRLRNYTLSLLSADLGMIEIIKEYRKSYSVSKRIKIASKNFIKCLPNCLYFRIKKDS